jgi:hypothetical protein
MSKITLRHYGLIAMSFISMLSLDIYPCKCTRVDINMLIEQSHEIFLGKVVSIELSSKNLDNTYYFLVLKSWKGTCVPYRTIRSAASGSECGANFQDGKVYLIYSRYSQTDMCMHPSLISDEKQVPKELGIPIYVNEQAND